jgi:hypothetical protein
MKQKPMKILLPPKMYASKTTPPRPQLPAKPILLNQEKPFTQPEIDFLGELRNVCVKIPLFQEIKDIPIYSKREILSQSPRVS